jgi:WD40 repeat protein
LTMGSALRFWDITSGQQKLEFPNHQGIINSIGFTPNGQTLVSGGGDIRVWEVATGKFLRQLSGRRVTGLAVLPNGRQVLSAELEGRLRLQDIDSAKEVRQIVADKKVAPGPQEGPVVWGLGLDPDGKSALSFSKEGEPGPAILHTWDLTSGKALHSLRVRDATNVRLFSPDARLFVRFERQQSPSKPRGRFEFQDESRFDVVLQDALTDKPALTLPQPDQFLFNPAFSADGQFFVTATNKPVRQGPNDREGPATLHLWELISGKEMQTILMSNEGTGHLQALVFGPDQRVIATASSGLNKSGGQEQLIQLWDIVSGKELMRRSGFDSNTRVLAFSPDGKTLVSGHEEGYLLAWDVSSVSPFKSSESRKATKEEWESWWADLAAEDTRKAGVAIWKWVDADSQAVGFLRDRLKPAPGPPADKMKQWIADLNSNEFQRREEATRQLADLQELALPALKEFLKGKPSAEQRRRIEGLLEPSLLVKSPDKKREFRSVQVLERIGNSESRVLLGELAKGAPEASLTINAKAAADRLDRKTTALAQLKGPKKQD